MVSQKQIKSFQKEILDWFSKHKRDLPWRKSRNPYSILISEVMLQQTQVGRVIPKFEAWMRRFPTVQILANASTRDVLLFWSGLGYNRRALYLQKMAQELMKNSNGTFPQDEKALRNLPGIGEYTASALLCFAFDQQIAVVDTNVRKVILTRFGKYVKDNPKDLKDFADLLLPKGKAYEWNQALMDYSSAVLKKEKIVIPKQSHFKTSNRFYRGQVIKLLLKHNKVTGRLLFKKIENNGISEETFEKILQTMVDEGMVAKISRYYVLP